MQPPSALPRDSAGYVPLALLLIVAGSCATVALILLGFVVATRPADLPAPSVTAVVVTAPAVAAPTQAPGGPDPQLTPAPSDTAPPPPPPGSVQIGAYVQVIGTGDAGFLNLRAEPGVGNPVNYLAIEREVFQVQAGPADADGFVWWYLVDPASGSRFGWGVQNYLQVVQGP